MILPIAGIAYLVAGRRAAVLAAWIAALCPAITFLPLSAGGSLGLFSLLTVTALWLGFGCAYWSPRRAALGAAGCGVLVGLAYLTRPEGLFYSVVLVGVLALPALGGWRGLFRARAPAWRRAGALFAAFAIPVVLLVAPYASYLHTNTGTWELTAKANAMSLDSWRAIAKGDRAAAVAEAFTLDRSGFRFRASEPVSGLVQRDPGAFLDIVGTNVDQLYKAFFDPASNPYPSWPLLPGVLLLFAAFGVWRRRHSRVVLATVAAIAIPCATAISYFVLPRYLIPSAALSCALVAVGILELPARTREGRDGRDAVAVAELDGGRAVQQHHRLVPPGLRESRAPGGRPVAGQAQRAQRPRHEHEQGGRVLRGPQDRVGPVRVARRRSSRSGVTTASASSWSTRCTPSRYGRSSNRCSSRTRSQSSARSTGCSRAGGGP